MVKTIETIEIISTFIDGVTRPIKQVETSIKRLNSQYEQVTKTTSKYNKDTKNMQVVTQSVSSRLRGFQFQWLGVMFAGMAVNRVVGTYIKGAMDMLGVNELMREGLSFMVFEALEPFSDILIELSAMFFDLPEPIQKLIGYLILGAGAFGTLAGTIGQVMLAFNSFAALGILNDLKLLSSGASGAGTAVSGFSRIMLLLSRAAFWGVVGLAFAGLTALIWDYVSSLAEADKKFQELGTTMKTLEGTTVPTGAVETTGTLPYQQRGTRTFGSPVDPSLSATKNDVFIPLDVSKFNFPPLSGSSSGGISTTVFNINNNISVADKNSYEESLRKFKDELAQQVRSYG